MKKVGEARHLAFKSRILVPPWMVPLRVLMEKRHYFWLSKYLLGWIGRNIIIFKKALLFPFFWLAQGAFCPSFESGLLARASFL